MEHLKIPILTVTEGGRRQAERLALHLPGSSTQHCRSGLAETVAELWPGAAGLVFIMAAGIVVRVIAPLLADKRRDPAVVVCDEAGRFAVSLLSGHLGGGNALAEEVARLLGGQAVITTASDVLGHTALDLWLRGHGLAVADRAGLTLAMGRLVNEGELRLASDFPVEGLPPDLRLAGPGDQADLHLTCRCKGRGLCLHPPALVAGIGCNRGASAAVIGLALAAACAAHGLAMESLGALASIDLKADEQGLIEVAAERGLTLRLFGREQLNAVEGLAVSAAVLKAVGAKGVAEPAAVLGANHGKLLVRKMKWKDVTVALALADWRLSALDRAVSNT